jgi:hypothetical protein
MHLSSSAVQLSSAGPYNRLMNRRNSLSHTNQHKLLLWRESKVNSKLSLEELFNIDNELFAKIIEQSNNPYAELLAKIKSTYDSILCNNSYDFNERILQDNERLVNKVAAYNKLFKQNNIELVKMKQQILLFNSIIQHQKFIIKELTQQINTLQNYKKNDDNPTSRVDNDSDDKAQSASMESLEEMLTRYDASLQQQ